MQLAIWFPTCTSNLTYTPGRESWLSYNHSCGEIRFLWCLCNMHISPVFVHSHSSYSFTHISFPPHNKAVLSSSKMLVTQSSGSKANLCLQCQPPVKYTAQRAVQCSWKACNKAGFEEKVGVNWDPSPKVTNTLRKFWSCTDLFAMEQKHQ